jgi:hypothetical protein
VDVTDAVASLSSASAYRRYFLQMRGRFTLDGRLLGAPVGDSGTGFFETYVAR